jgi:hypothetical protein
MALASAFAEGYDFRAPDFLTIGKPGLTYAVGAFT